MKIAVTGIRGIPARFGGVERHSQELYTRLAQYGCETKVYVRDNYIEKDIKEFEGVKIKKISTPNTKHSEAIVHTFKSLVNILLRDKPDIVHIHAIGPSFLSFMPKLRGIKVVCTCHGLDWQRGKWGEFAKFCLKQGERNAALFADKVICVSKTLQKYFKEKHKINAQYIPNGVIIPKKLKADIIKEKYGLVQGDYFLFTGRLVPEKGIHYLIEAFKNIDTNKKLAIVGGSSHTDEYEKTLKEMAKGDNRIIFTGYCYGEELSEFYSNTYCYIIPSDLEGLPIALLEAASYEIPIIASNIKPNVEVIEEHEKYGFLFKKGCMEDLKKKIIYTLEHPEKNQKIASRALETVKNNYNWKGIVKDTFKLYQNILR